MSKYTTIQQHEPLRVPAGWGQQEKRFIAQLEETLDDLYRRFNRLKMTDLGQSLQNIIKSDHASIEVLNDTVTLTAGEGMEIGSVNITRAGITMTGGKIELSATTELTLAASGLVVDDDGVGIGAVQISRNGIAMTGGTISLSASTELTLAASGLVVDNSGVDIGAVKITRNGITMTGGTISLSASTELTLAASGLVVDNSGVGIGAVQITRNGITMTGGTISLSATTALTLSASGLVVNNSGVGIGAVTLTRNGIAMSGGEISLSASASLTMASAGLVDINGASGSINLGEGSQIRSDAALFDSLTVNGVNYLPIIYSNTRPAKHKIFWAQPITPPPGYSLSGGCYTWGPRTELTHGITQNYGTSFDNAQSYFYDAGAITAYTANSIKYQVTVPIIRVSGATVSRTLYAAIYRTDANSLGRVTFSGVTKSFKAGVVTNVTFEATSSTNLTQNGSDASFAVHVWGTGATESNAVYVQADSYVDILITDVNQSSSDEACTIYYIP